MLGLLGLCIGSFLNVVIHRLPLMMERQWLMDSAAQLSDAAELKKAAAWKSVEADTLARSAQALSQQLDKLPHLGIATPRSRCPHCGHQLAWHENLPLIGWLRLGGKCAACKATISKRYPLIELATGLLFAALSWRFGARPETLLWCGFGATLLALAAIDWDTTLLPDSLNQPLLWAGLAASPAELDRPALELGLDRRPCWATSRSGPSIGCSSWPPARRAWAMATSSCWPPSVPGWVGR